MEKTFCDCVCHFVSSWSEEEQSMSFGMTTYVPGDTWQLGLGASEELSRDVGGIFWTWFNGKEQSWCGSSADLQKNCSSTHWPCTMPARGPVVVGLETTASAHGPVYSAKKHNLDVLGVEGMHLGFMHLTPSLLQGL